MPATIQLRNVQKTFRLGENLVKALNGVSLDINPGLTALMGPSGSGKSTLLNMIGALDCPDNGDIVISGVSLSKLDASERAQFRNQHCGFIFQNFNLIPVLSAVENVQLPCQLAKEPPSFDLRKRALELLEAVDLSAQADQRVNRLSGGQMQRVAIARALMNHPKVILADEPTANLDQNTAASIMSLLKNLAESNRACIVIATHDHSVVSYCDAVVNVRDGAIVQ